MDKKKQNIEPESFNTCSWCNKEIPEDSEVFAVDAKAKKGIDLKDKEGKIIPFFLALANKTIPAIVTASNSEAKKEGKDLIFMICSQECGKFLREAFQIEIDLIDGIDI